MTPTQASQKPVSPLGVQAAAAATTSGGPGKPAEPKPAESKTETDDDDKKSRASRKVYVVVGEIHEFDSVNKAEKFLNASDAPKTYTVLRGNRIGTSQKVSLR
jgi:hypothetical protein